MKAKQLPFEYFVYQLHNWYKEAFDGVEKNDLSTLKILKLLFFVSAVGTNKDSQNTLIDEIFDNFCAMPYGHVESDIYNFIKNNQIVNIKFDTKASEILNIKSILEIDDSQKNIIDKQISLLKEINFNLIKYTSFELVELSHKWYSWQKNYRMAKEQGAYSHPISKDEIKEEIKIYQL